MYDVSIVPAPIQRRRALVQEPDELEKVDQHVEEVALVTQTQSDTGYVSLVMMMSVFRTGYYDSGVDQSSDFKTQYMHGHGHDRGEHNEYLYYEALAAVLEEPDEQQQQENWRNYNNKRIWRNYNNKECKVDGYNQLEIVKVQVVEHIDFFFIK
ncbi:GATA zinc finger domain-containing protein 10-like isoform X2 [Cucumis melo var. makuwa]|uniref:GATA zinc finger domain-containing protein 10-like isoform X2 n=2 Tax=Cucumis melo TaxID=3656 RepID=A0A5A7SI16_CUCMM|nr:GATA zinc finger domain-containing protein 10-like isoform X2 [Cucumis melo var. makuwa]